MRIAILSPFYPYRGGIAQFSAMLYNALAEKGNNVKAFNFKKLYPDFLFPGKTQYVEKNDTAITVESDRCLNSINPCSYITTLKHIKAFQPDILIISYWMSFFAPEYAYIAHGMKKRCKVIARYIIPEVGQKNKTQYRNEVKTVFFHVYLLYKIYYFSSIKNQTLFWLIL